MIYAHDSGFSAKKAGGIGLTVALHVLVACGVIYGLHRSFVRPIDGTPLILKPLPKIPHQEDPIDKVFKLPAHPEMTIPPLTLPPVNIQPDAPHASLPTENSNPGPENPHGKAGGEAGGSTDGGVKTGVPVSKPVITNLESCKPEYPRPSLLKEESGTVRVRFEIGADSKLVAANVLHSSGYPMLDRAAVNALSQCQFKAAVQDGVPVSSSLVTEYVWKLANE